MSWCMKIIEFPFVFEDYFSRVQRKNSNTDVSNFHFCTVRFDNVQNSFHQQTLAKLSVSSLRMVRKDRNM
jgi:hypothetical protein